MKSYILATLTLATSFAANSQHHVDFSMHAGTSTINSMHTDLEQSQSRTRIEDLQKWSFDFGANYAYQFNKWMVRCGISFCSIKGETLESFTVYPLFHDDGFPSLIELSTTRTASYLRIPLTINYQYDKVQLGVGVYGAYLLTNSVWAAGYNNSDPMLFQGSGNTLAKFDVGVMAEISYQLDEKFDLLVAANAGMVDISNGSEQGAVQYIYGLEPHQRSLRNRQLTAGLRYHLF